MNILCATWTGGHVIAREAALKHIGQAIQWLRGKLDPDCIYNIVKLFIWALMPNYPVIYERLLVKNQYWVVPFIYDSAHKCKLIDVICAETSATLATKFAGPLTKRITQLDATQIKVYIGYVIKYDYTFIGFPGRRNFDVDSNERFVGTRVIIYTTYDNVVHIPYNYVQSAVALVDNYVERAFRGPLHIVVKIT